MEEVRDGPLLALLHTVVGGSLLTHDYSRKKGILYSEVILCDNAPVIYKDRSQLWNAVELTEKDSKAQLSRELEIALPNELNLERQILLVQ